MELFSYFFQSIHPNALRASLATPHGRIELVVAAGLFFGCYFLFYLFTKDKSLIKGKGHSKRTIQSYIKYRLGWPILLGITLTTIAFIWHEFAPDEKFVWLSFFCRAAFWVGIIRAIFAMIRYITPNHFLTTSLENSLFITLWACFALWLTGFSDVILKWMHRIKLPIGKSQLSLLDITSAIFWISVVLFFTLWLSKIIEARVMKLHKININARIVINKVISIISVVLAILIVLPMVGIDLTVLSVFGGALGVGLGFGLQKIASSYVSGFIILLERSLRLGDMVEINSCKGIVEKITSRYVVLKSSSGYDYLIPNDNIISNTVTNLSLANNTIWDKVDVSVAYDTDLDFALSLLVKAAKHERILDSSPATPYLISFGDSAINLAVGFWVKDSEKSTLGLKSDVLMNIWHLFKEHNIEMPFPQREIRILKNDGSEDKPPL